MMRCATCHEDVDEGRAMPMAPGLHLVWEDPRSLLQPISLGPAIGEPSRTLLHLRYVPGVLSGPETTA